MRGSTKAILAFMVIVAAAVFILGLTHPNGIMIDLSM